MRKAPALEAPGVRGDTAVEKSLKQCWDALSGPWEKLLHRAVMQQWDWVPRELRDSGGGLRLG